MTGKVSNYEPWWTVDVRESRLCKKERFTCQARLIYGRNRLDWWDYHYAHEQLWAERMRLA